MAYLIDFTERIVELLRSIYTEPARTGLVKRHNNQTSYPVVYRAWLNPITLATDTVAVVGVTDDGATMIRYRDYDLDLRVPKVFHRPGFEPATNSNMIYTLLRNTVNSGVSWINKANSERDNTDVLDIEDYPRVTVQPLIDASKFISIESDTQQNSIILQFDVAIKEGIELADYVRYKSDGTTETITETLQNGAAVDVLVDGIIGAFKHNWRDNKYWFYLDRNFVKGVSEIKIDHDLSIFRKVIDIEFKGFDLGESN